MRRVEKPWGREVIWADNEHYAAKILVINAGHSLSRQYHELKHETLFVQDGRLLFELDGERLDLGPGDIVEVPPGTVHRMTATVTAVVLEASTPHLDDVVRLYDDYGRAA